MEILKPIELSYAESEKNTSFDLTPSKKQTASRRKPQYISYQTIAGIKYVVQVKSGNSFHESIFQALAAASISEWFIGNTATTQKGHFNRIRRFVNWLNQYDIDRNEDNKYECLTSYGVYQRNVLGLKHCDALELKFIISNGLQTTFLSPSEIRYLDNVILLTKANEPSQSSGYTLTRWFCMPWLRSILGENAYLQLESPRRLISSFRITIATTLLYLLECRQIFEERRLPLDHAVESEPISEKQWNEIFLNSIGRFDSDGFATDILTATLLQDFINPSLPSAFHPRISIGNNRQLDRWTNDQGMENRTWREAKLFTPSYLTGYCWLEEILAAWLLACSAIQPSDIPKLAINNFVMERNEKGRLILMQCKYFKGRSGRHHESPMMMASDCSTQALYRYLLDLPNQNHLFSTNVGKSIYLPRLGSAGTCNSEIRFLHQLWKMPQLRQRLDAEFQRGNASSIFLDAMLALELGTPSRASLRDRSSQPVGDSNERTLPSYLFKLSHLKTSAVHAGSDQYRDADLINHHSHTSQTEKHSYLTDSNKDWVNQLGRITRLVLHDLENAVYCPSIQLFKKNVLDRNSRTHVIQASETDEPASINTKDEAVQNMNAHYLIVSDTLDSALYFEHYINEAETHFKKILQVRPDFVERTLLVQVEWMTRTLLKMRQAKAAKSMYPEIKKHLPPMFEYLWLTIE